MKKVPPMLPMVMDKVFGQEPPQPSGGFIEALFSNGRGRRMVEGQKIRANFFAEVNREVDNKANTMDRIDKFQHDRKMRQLDLEIKQHERDKALLQNDQLRLENMKIKLEYDQMRKVFDEQG